jgi:hypothetical protein
LATGLKDIGDLKLLPLLRVLFFALCAVGAGMASVAHAALGGAYASVEADRAHMSAKLNSTLGSTYSVHALALPNGGVTREYTRADGIVFAIAWQGPSRPDLRQLLGAYFETFQSDNALHHGRRARRPLSVQRPDIVVQSAGHSGAFWGLAYLPQAAPAGFSINDF